MESEAPWTESMKRIESRGGAASPEASFPPGDAVKQRRQNERTRRRDEAQQAQPHHLEAHLAILRRADIRQNAAQSKESAQKEQYRRDHQADREDHQQKLCDEEQA